MSAESNDNVFRKVIEHVTLCDNMVLMEFGTASGNTLASIMRCFSYRGKLPTQVFSFDSFTGLCDEIENLFVQEDWHKGAFNLFDELNKNDEFQHHINSLEDGINLVKGRFAQYNDIVQFIIGYYEHTLNKQTIRKYGIGPASFIHIDSDLYISCKQVLKWLFDNKLLLKNCIVRYDNWRGKGGNEWEFGESRAHLEATKQYNIVWERVNMDNNDVVFIYRGMGR